VLNGLTVNFVDNAITTILGPSGTGKSVLLSTRRIACARPGEISVFARTYGESPSKTRMNCANGSGSLPGRCPLRLDERHDNVAYSTPKAHNKSEDEIAT